MHDTLARTPNEWRKKRATLTTTTNEYEPDNKSLKSHKINNTKRSAQQQLSVRAIRRLFTAVMPSKAGRKMKKTSDSRTQRIWNGPNEQEAGRL